MAEVPELSVESVVHIESLPPNYSMLRGSCGNFLGCSEDGLVNFGGWEADLSCWVAHDDDTYQHATTHTRFKLSDLRKSLRNQRGSANGSALERGLTAVVETGLSSLPSEFLSHFIENGWVCIPEAVTGETLANLESLAMGQDGGSGAFENDHNVLQRAIAVARACTEPVSLWLIRQYLQADTVRLAAPPALSVIPRDDGSNDVLGWHTDYPYSGGILDSIPPGPGFPMAVQRILCISPFTLSNGATRFKLGSHRASDPIPCDWGLARDYFTAGYRKSRGSSVHKQRDQCYRGSTRKLHSLRRTNLAPSRSKSVCFTKSRLASINSSVFHQAAHGHK